MLRLLCMLLAALIPALADAQEIPSVAEWESAWSKVLSRHVDAAGQIHFSGLPIDHADLDWLVGFIAAIDPASRPERFPSRAAKLAYYINAYNALAMYGVVQAGVPEALSGLTKLGFFHLRTFNVGGKSI